MNSYYICQLGEGETYWEVSPLQDAGSIDIFGDIIVIDGGDGLATTIQGETAGEALNKAIPLFLAYRGQYSIEADVLRELIETLIQYRVYNTDEEAFDDKLKCLLRRL